nr:phosphonopyruvate decarboxylase [uncultured Actinoplanes sp.]
MIGTDTLLGELDRRGFDFFTGVPCSYLAGPIAALSAAGRYRPAANEGAALALAAGAVTGGRRAAVLMQNSGFGNLINPLTSLIMPYRIPVLVLMTLRGWPDPDGDEPQHRVMGLTTHGLLDLVGVRHWTLSSEDIDVAQPLKAADEELAEGRPAVLLVAKGAVANTEVPSGAPDAGPAAQVLPGTGEAVAAVLDAFPGALFVSTTGYASRHLFAQGDSPRCFYMQGSMGHASAFALGVADAARDERVVLIDGDGAALMHLGSMATIGTARPPGLVHVLLDNGTYESTGGQRTTTAEVDFAGTAGALGYRHAVTCRGREESRRALREAARREGPVLVVVKTSAGAGPVPPRATAAMAAADIRARFAAAVAGRPG